MKKFAVRFIKGISRNGIQFNFNNLNRIRVSITILLSMMLIQGFSQQAGNEWIVYNQQYFTIPVYQKGIHRVSYNSLMNAGVPIGNFDPRSFQVFARGEEQPIYVQNESTGTFNPGDYIEFFGEPNDGWFDQFLYQESQKQPNPNYSLINDTIMYYITWNNSLNNRRYAVKEDNNFSGLNPAPWFWYTSRQDYTTNYYEGETNNYGVTEPYYTEAEGWFDQSMNLGQSRTKTIETPNIFTAGPAASIEFAVAGASNYRPLNPDHHLQVQFAGQMIDTIYEGYTLLRFNASAPANSLNAAGTPFIFSSVNSLGSPVDRSAIAYVSVKYPHNFQLRNQPAYHLELPPSTGTRTLIGFSEFQAAADAGVWVYNLTNREKIRAYLQDGQYRAIVSNPTQSRKLFITSESQTIEVSAIKPVSGDPLNFARFRNYLSGELINSDYILISHSLLMEQAAQYRDFRNSTGYKVLLVDVDELYSQFSYGINKHPAAIRNFISYLLESYSTRPKMLFILGKTRGALAYRKNASVYATSLVPSFGNPPSDVLITSGLDGNGYAPALATGRLAAQSPEHASWYLNKAIQHENERQIPQEWMKNILHFGGGSSINEQNILAGYLKGYTNVMQDTLFGGYVRTFLKSSTDPIQINQSDSLKQIINSGVSFMTFFGHAAGIGFDISIDYPSEYSNYGKYPFLVANSCFAGDIFGAGVNSSEEFVLIEEKGVIGYLAATTATGAFELNRYSTELFSHISAKSYGEPIGSILQKTINEIQSTNLYIRNACLMVTLHGDPAVILNSQPKPDYKTGEADIFFTPKDVTTEIDSFAVNVIVTNLGKAIRDSIFIELERKFPDGVTELFQKRIPTTLYKDTLVFRMPVDRERGIGINQFSLVIDALNQVDEISKANNRATQNLFIKSSDIIPVYPPEYAVIPTSQITLMASTGNPFAAQRMYTFELDTTALFINPTSESITAKGGVVAWNPPISLTEGQVYYWRVSIQPNEGEEFIWRSSSFRFMEDQTGWSQAHFDQFGRNSYRFVSHNPEEGIWDFTNSVNSILAQTGIYPYLAWTEQFIRVNGITLSTFACMADVGNGVYFMVFDPISAERMMSVNQGNNLGQYDNYHCSQRDASQFEFYSTSDLWRQRMQAFIDTIPDGFKVLALSHRNHNAENYHEELYQAFESLGSANIRNLVNNTPYLIFGTKGSLPGSANEVIGSSITSTIQLNDSIVTNWNEGHIESTLIGPSSQWNSLSWNYSSIEPEDTDSVTMDLLGITPDNQMDTLIRGMVPNEKSIDISQQANAAQYPYIKLLATMQDDVNRTPAQMDHWTVIHEGIPETAIDPSLHYIFDRDSVMEGETIRFSTAIHNISPYDMDSLLVSYWVVDKNRQLHPIDYPRTRPHPAGDILIDTIVINTKGLAGNNSLWMEVNPANDQLEQYSFNNVGQIQFFVNRDQTNPILEVTFDGMQIMDGDIVSTNPFILISLQDENPFLELTDTTLVKVFLSTPDNPEQQRIYFTQAGQQTMRFVPATLPDNKCVIEYEPVFTADGEYSIRVQATDESQNESGMFDYVISFEVITKSTITEVLNWPNPFSTATHFVFTLTGSQLPTYMKIQIMTITGRVVKEIDLAELGSLRIGKNITTYAWDGRDEFGDQLANGVYLYRVITNIENNEIELNNTAAQKYFHNGIGKMYLMR